MPDLEAYGPASVKPLLAELEHCHNFTRERLYTLLRQVDFDPCHYAVNARYLAGMEVIARKLGETVSPAAPTEAVQPPGAPEGKETSGRRYSPPSAPNVRHSHESCSPSESRPQKRKSPVTPDASPRLRRPRQRRSAQPGGRSRLNVGCGVNVIPGWINMDVTPLPGVDVVVDLDRCRESFLPFPSDYFDEFLLSHLIEHIRDPLALMEELHRIAKPNARAVVRLPYGSSDDAFEDPTHVRQYFKKSLGYFSQPYYWRADYGYRGDWKITKIDLAVERRTHEGMTPEQILERVNTLRNVVLEMAAELRAVKPIRERRRELQFQPAINFALM